MRARVKDLPLLRFRKQSVAEKMTDVFSMKYARLACCTCPRGKPFMAKRQIFGGTERFFDRACVLTFLLERVSERVAGLRILSETVVCL